MDLVLTKCGMVFIKIYATTKDNSIKHIFLFSKAQEKLLA